ncbi:MAG TPA: hypothetical protein VFK06_24870 [Candidatus Angelobacter sp.]|nr:hypothetical protein [Candidatus Angelobacter sp.]
MHSKILRYLFLMTFLLVSALAANNPQREVYSLAETKVSPFALRDASLQAVLRELSSLTQVAFCQELVSNTASSFDKTEGAFSADENQGLGDILNKLQKQYPITWKLENNIIVIQALDVVQLKDNPLDAKLKPFTFFRFVERTDFISQ